MALTNGTNGKKSINLLGLQDFLQSIRDVTRDSFVDDGERNAALLAAYALVSRLETPWETVLRIAMSQPAVGAALKVVRDLRLFEIWHERGPQSSKTLAQWVRCDALLLQRLLRHLVANNLLEEVESAVFKQTPFSVAMLDPAFGEWINYLYDATLPCFFTLPEFLINNGYSSPTDPANGIFQHTKRSTGDLFEYYAEHRREGKTFNNIMAGVMSRQASWLDIFPHETLVSGISFDESIVLVDVGGNVGHDLNRFRNAHPELAGRLVLQDRPEVVQDSVCPAPTRNMGHNFFTEQPIKGARAYYMHGVLHDWSDEPARRILDHIRAAMAPGFSTLLIHDHVISESNPHPQATAYDLTMMVKVAALERSESMWRDLLTSSKLKIVRIWQSPLATQSIIEAEPT